MTNMKKFGLFLVLSSAVASVLGKDVWCGLAFHFAYICDAFE